MALGLTDSDSFGRQGGTTRGRSEPWSCRRNRRSCRPGRGVDNHGQGHHAARMDQPADNPVAPAVSVLSPHDVARLRLRLAVADATPEQREKAIQIAARLFAITAKKERQQRISEGP